MVDRLAEDHLNARYLAEQINTIPKLSVDMSTVESNIVNVDHAAAALSTNDTLKLFEHHGVLASGRPPRHVRLCVNRHHDHSDMDEVLRRLRVAAESI